MHTNPPSFSSSSSLSELLSPPDPDSSELPSPRISRRKSLYFASLSSYSGSTLKTSANRTAHQLLQRKISYSYVGVELTEKLFSVDGVLQSQVVRDLLVLLHKVQFVND